jgi:hypothetical protein
LKDCPELTGDVRADENQLERWSLPASAGPVVAARPGGGVHRRVQIFWPRSSSILMKRVSGLADTRHIPETDPACLRLTPHETWSRHMPTIRQIVFGLVLATGMLSAGQARADRPPTPEERSRIEAMLHNEGFTDWGAIALDDDDGVWEVDDAYASDGHRYDLRLHPNTFEIIQREPDDD